MAYVFSHPYFPGANFKIFYTERQQRENNKEGTFMHNGASDAIPCASRNTGSFDAPKTEMSRRISVSPDER